MTCEFRRIKIGSAGPAKEGRALAKPQAQVGSPRTAPEEKGNRKEPPQDRTQHSLNHLDPRVTFV